MGLASLVTIMLLGHWIEMRSISQASGALRELAKRANLTRVVFDKTGTWHGASSGSSILPQTEA